MNPAACRSTSHDLGSRSKSLLENQARTGERIVDREPPSTRRIPPHVILTFSGSAAAVDLRKNLNLSWNSLRYLDWFMHFHLGNLSEKEKIFSKMIPFPFILIIYLFDKIAHIMWFFLLFFLSDFIFLVIFRKRKQSKIFKIWIKINLLIYNFLS